MDNEYRSKSLAHLGLVSGMIDELGLVEAIDKHLQIDGKERQVSLGILCKALILNGLGFTQRTLYMVSTFFEDKPTEVLLGAGIEPSQLNDTSLGRCLDAIQSYGCTTLYANLAAEICQKLGLAPTTVHLDSTDFHLEGVYNAKEAAVNEHLIHLRPGYSRDKRPDLNQAVLNLIVENQAGIALHMEGLDGNTSDKTAFNATIREHIGQLRTVLEIDYVVMDSAGYTAPTIGDCGEQTKWISRVPETIKECQAAVLGKHDQWTEISPGQRAARVASTYGGVRQRWLVIFSQERYEREKETLKKNYLKESEREYRAFVKLKRVEYECQKDAEKAVEDFAGKCKYISLSEIEYCEKKLYEKKGRPGKEAPEVGKRYVIAGQAYCERAKFAARAEKKGKFIIATNELDEEKLSDPEMLRNYKGQAKVERGFRFLKDPQFMAATFFVKKPERVEALLFIMTLCLSVYAALEYRVREKLKAEEETLPNQLGKGVKNPTMRWLFACFSGVHVLYGEGSKQVLNIKPLHLKVLRLLGPNYLKYYLLN
jgi:transposase